MTDELESSLSRITDQPPPPSAETDKRAEAEEEEFKRAKILGGMSPKVLHLHQIERFIKHLEDTRDGLTNECNQLRDRCNELAPRVAELEHAERVAKVLIRDGSIISIVGGSIISFAGLFGAEITRFPVCGIGGGLMITGLWVFKLTARWAWPPKRPTDSG